MTIHAQQKLDLTLDFGFIENEELPVIDPRNLQCLNLNVGAAQFSWDIFNLDGGEGDINFDCLTQLTLVGDPISYSNQEHDDDAFIDDVDFEALVNSVDSPSNKIILPMLTQLTVSYICLSDSDARQLMRPSLKKLSLTGKSAHALIACEQIDCLDELNMEFVIPMIEENDASFMCNMKEIFSLARRVPHVTCKVYSPQSHLEAKGINWLNVYKLELDLLSGLDSIAAAISKMPDLEVLTLNIHNFVGDNKARTMEFLNSLRQTYSEPLPSKIHTLNVVYDKGKQGDAFSNALEELKWLLPRLAAIKISGKINDYVY